MPSARRTVAEAGTNPSELPLGALLHRAAALFAADFDDRLADSEFPDLSLAHARNVLRHLADGPLRASQIVGRCEVSKQAVSQQIAQLAASGYVQVEPDPADHRARILALTPDGRRAMALARRVFAEIEQDWAVRMGPADAEALRSGLTAIIVRSPDPDC